MNDIGYLRSNTIVGDRAHAKGMVVARIIKGNIPVKNGVVHLIDKPLMIVSRSLFEYLRVCNHIKWLSVKSSVMN